MKIVIFLVFVTVMTATNISKNAHAALASDSTLLLAGQPSSNYFALDVNADYVFDPSEIVNIEAGVDGGIKLGSIQLPGDIDTAWSFGGSIGYHTQAATISIASDDGEGNITLDMSGWNINWNNDDIGFRYSRYGGIVYATLTCDIDCSDGDSFNLVYATEIQCGAIDGCAEYQLNLRGTISSVPIPSSIWLLSSGLLSLFGMVRAKNNN